MLHTWYSCYIYVTCMYTKNAFYMYSTHMLHPSTWIEITYRCIHYAHNMYGASNMDASCMVHPTWVQQQICLYFLMWQKVIKMTISGKQCPRQDAQPTRHERVAGTTLAAAVPGGAAPLPTRQAQDSLQRFHLRCVLEEHGGQRRREPAQGHPVWPHCDHCWHQLPPTTA